MSSFINKTIKVSLEFLYIIFIVPNAWWAKHISDPLALKPTDKEKPEETLWMTRKTKDTKLDHARRQY
jgi:hypothetical protein